MNDINFKELIIKLGQIRIPQIQRDYAQGRRNKMVDEIRENFVRSLLLVVMGKKPETQLDFVYGSDRDGAFEPLDGQQRLTTLFLLHWVLGVDLKSKNDNDEPILTYETRNTSKAFCKELITHDAKQFVDEAKSKTEKSKKLAEEEKKKPEEKRDKSLLEPHIYKVSEIIQNRDWFQWAWRFDPTVSSMLVMIDTICEQMDWNLEREKCRPRLEKIKFNYLDLGQLGMSDELFIKMNARGKQLSSFDKLKSTLEEEIQLQQNEQNSEKTPLADSKIEKEWRKLMDGKWIDLFWQKEAEDIANKKSEEQLEVAERTERKFRIFLLRMIGMQLFAEMGNVISNVKSEDKGCAVLDKLYEAAYKNNESDLDDLLLAYQNQLTDWRSNQQNRQKPDDCLTIDFKKIIDSINRWIIEKEAGVYADITTLLAPEDYFDGSRREASYFDLFVDDKIANGVTVTLYALQLFLEAFPYQKESDAWKINFKEWTRMARNVFNDDNNTDRLNNRQDVAKAFGGIRDMVTDFQNTNPAVDTNANAVVKFLCQCNKTYTGIDNQSLNEEKDKAQLRMIPEDGANWTEAIKVAEEDPYLWGQIRCLIHWADGDLNKFKQYSDRLTKWINTKDEKVQEKYYTAVLCSQPDCLEQNDNLYLYEFNKNRDNSLKRYLRDEPYGESVKNLIDKWIDWNPKKSFQEFCEYSINNAQPKGWVKYFLKYPEMIWESWRKRIFKEKGHVIFARLKTTESRCFDPVFLYLQKLAKDANIEVTMRDSKSDGSYGLKIGNTDISWADKDGEYLVDGKSYDLEGMVEKFQDILHKCTGNE